MSDMKCHNEDDVPKFIKKYGQLRSLVIIPLIGSYIEINVL